MNIRKELAQILSFLKPHLGRFLLTTSIDAVIMSLCFNTMIAFVTKNIFSAATKGDIQYIFYALLLAGSAFLFGILIEPLFKYASYRYVSKSMGNIRLNVYDRLAHMTIEEFEKHHSGDLLSRVTYDLSNVERLYINQIFLFVFSLVTGGIPLIMIFFLDWRMGIIIGILGVITLILNRQFAKRTQKTAEDIQKDTGKLNQILMDILESLTVSKIFHLETKMEHWYKNQDDQLSKDTLKQDRIKAQFLSISAIFENMNVLIIFIGFFFVLSGSMDVGTVMAITLLQTQVNYLFSNISSIFVEMQNAITSSHRIIDLLHLPVEEDASPTAHDLSRKNASSEMVLFDNVSFSYDTKRLILNQLNLSIEKQTSVAIVGASGCGKSTLIKLLLKFFSPQSGTLLVENQNIFDWAHEDLRDQIAYVAQVPYLFEGTIEDNIRFGQMNSSQEDIVSAAKAANAHDFIMQLPDAYQTQVVSGGDNFSGGQRQRINIARAILKNAPILVLDEATSALDAESEFLVQQSISSLIKGKTSIMIAHKLNTIKQVDQIIVLDAGHVTEMGTHEELLSKKSSYHHLYQSQMRETLR